VPESVGTLTLAPAVTLATYADDGEEAATTSPEPVSILEADARIRTADPFITS
jgi:hypothetical protein